MATYPLGDFSFIGRIPACSCQGTVTWEGEFIPEDGYANLPPKYEPFDGGYIRVFAGANEDSKERDPVSPGVLVLTPTVTDANGRSIVLEPLYLNITLGGESGSSGSGEQYVIISTGLYSPVEELVTNKNGIFLAIGMRNFSNFSRSTDNGITWSDPTEIYGLYSVSGAGSDNQNTFVIVGGNGVSGNVAVSNDLGVSWVATYYENVMFSDVATNENGVWMAVGENEYADQKILRSTDNGNSWEFIASGVPYIRFTSVCTDKNGTWVISAYDTNARYNYGKMIRSTDNGNSWQLVSTVSTVTGITKVVYGDGAWLAYGSQYGNGFFIRSIDGGLNWEPIEDIYAILVGGSDPFNNYIDYLTTDGNGTWVASCSYTGAVISTDNGITWSELMRYSYSIYSSATDGNGVWIFGVDTGRVLRILT